MVTDADDDDDDDAGHHSTTTRTIIAEQFWSCFSVLFCTNDDVPFSLHEDRIGFPAGAVQLVLLQFELVVLARFTARNTAQ